MFFIKAIFSAITIACMLITITFVFLAYHSPDTLNDIMCELQTTSDIENTACRMNLNYATSN